MTTTRAFKQVDVFTTVPLMGNPVAVILDAEGLSTETMQAIANWTNLSETTFVTAATDPAADYAVRIFTPKSELPFAGHPTLGTAHAVIEAGLASFTGGKIIQQCAIGLVEISQTGSALSFRLPRYSFEDAADVDCLTAALGDGAIVGTPQIVNVGPPENLMIGDYCHILGQLAIHQPGGRLSIGHHSFVGPLSRVWAPWAPKTC